MNSRLIRDAVDDLRKVAKKSLYRHLFTKDLLDIEVCLQQILLEVEMQEPESLWKMIKKSLRELK